MVVPVVVLEKAAEYVLEVVPDAAAEEVSAAVLEGTSVVVSGVVPK